VTKVAHKENEGKPTKEKSKPDQRDSRRAHEERLCEAKLFHHEGNTLRSKANPSKNLLCFTKPIDFDRLAFQSITIERLCEAKPIDHDAKAQRSKANPSR
jgi:hypothetical protein